MPDAIISYVLMCTSCDLYCCVAAVVLAELHAALKDLAAELVGVHARSNPLKTRSEQPLKGAGGL